MGSVPELFDVELAPGRKFELAAGQWFAPGAAEAVAGSFAAAQLGLRPGDTFHPFHGLTFDERNRHAETYTVAGVLAPTNTPADRVIWLPLAGIQTMGGHDPRAATDVSAVLIQLRAPTAGFMLDMLYNKQGNRLTFAYPVGAIIAELFKKIAWFDRVLELVAYLVALVAAGAVLASIYNSMSARQRDIAILRALGARRRTIFGAVLGEAVAIGVLGALSGVVVYAGLFSAVAGIIREQTGVVLTVAAWHPALALAPLGMIVLCALGGVVPALKAYRVSVADTLAPQS